jgi:hypothetical protein
MNKTVLALAVALAFGAVTAVQARADAPVAPMQEMSQSHANASAMNWFGGPTYGGAPALEATAALVAAGGGASNFSFSKALVSMLGEKTVNAEVAKLNKQYGEKNVTNFINGMTFAVNAGLKRATAAGVKLPAAPADLKGAKLAEALVKAGTAPDGVWWSGYLFDVALSHDIHVGVMQDIDAKFGHGADENTHKILNQAMYDVAQALKVPNVKLASLH